MLGTYRACMQPQPGAETRENECLRDLAASSGARFKLSCQKAKTNFRNFEAGALTVASSCNCPS